jgi:PAS domain S-box-containing protein
MRIPDSRLSPAIRLERLALILRYLAYAVLTAIFFLQQVRGSYRDFVVITGVVLLHNAFVHAVLRTRRYRLFDTALNFAIYLVETSLVVMFTGAEESELFVLYLFVLIGYTVYRRSFSRILTASFICCAAYGAVILVEWRVSGITMPFGIICGKLMSIVVCGWLVATLSRLLQQAEEVSAARARAVASSEATLRTILDSTADSILVYDDNECVTEANNRACEVLGVSREAILGRRFRTFLFDDGALPDRLSEARDKTEHHGEEVLISAEGRERTVDLHIRSFIRDQQRFFVCVAHDITEQKNLQEATHLANTNLARLNRELQQVNELKTGLLTAIAQRIRSPLTAILGYLDMVLNDELGVTHPEQRKALQNCRRSADRVFRIIDEVVQAPSGDAARDK